MRCLDYQASVAQEEYEVPEEIDNLESQFWIIQHLQSLHLDQKFEMFDV